MSDVTSLETTTSISDGLRYPEWHPPVEYKTFRLLNKIPPDVQGKIFSRVPEAKYPLLVLSRIKPGEKVTKMGQVMLTGMPVTVLQEIKTPIFSNYTYFCDVKEDSWRKNVLIGPIVEATANYVTQDEMPATMFLGTLRKEANKPVIDNKGYESIVGTGGYHVDIEDISNREGSKGLIMKNAVVRFTLNLLQNLVKWDPENAEMAQQYIDDIEQNGWEKVLNATGNKNLSDLPRKTIKDDSFDLNNQRLIKDGRGDFILRELNLKKDGLNAIVFRCFSPDGEKYVDLSATQLILTTDETLETILTQGKGIYTWLPSDGIDKERQSNAPFCNLFITDKFPDENSKLYKYRGNRGKSMGLGIIDLGEKGRVFEVGGSHLTVDGMAQSKNLRAYLHDMPIIEGKGKKVEFPAFIIYPPLPRVEIKRGQEVLQEIGLSDFVVIQEFDSDRLTNALKEFNSLVVAPKTTDINKILNDSGMSPDDADSIARMFAPFLSRSTLIQFVAEAFQGKMMNCVPYGEQDYYRMGMAITKSPPDRLKNQLQLGISGKKMDLSELFEWKQKDNLLVTTISNLDASRLEMTVTKKGIPTLGGIQSLTNKATGVLRTMTSFIHDKFLTVARQIGFVSDKTSKEDGDIFITAQNHQEQTMGFL